MSRFSTTFVFVLAAPGAIACGYRQGPPVQAPSPVVPAAVAPLVASAPPDGAAVVLEANGEAAKVSEVFASTAQSPGGALARVESLKPLCLTPCRVELPPGLHELRFASRTDERASNVDVTIDGRSKVVRHALGEQSRSGGGVVVGGLLVGFGGALTLGAMASAGKGGGDRERRDRAMVLAPVGAVTAALGVLAMALGRPERRAGATTEVLLPRRAPSLATADATGAALDR